MKIQEIVDLWTQDCAIDQIDLGSAALATPKLHAKYYKLFLQEKDLLQQLAGAVKLLRLEKYEMYTQGPTAALTTNWKQKNLPDQGLVIKADSQRYIDADLDVLNVEQRYQAQLEKTKFLESIISSLKDRGYAIKNAIDFRKFEMGG